jgi:hypothetical protein
MFMLRSSLACFYEETFRWGPLGGDMAALLSEQGKLLVFARTAALLLIAFTPFSEIFLRPNVVPSDEYIESTWLIYFFVISGFGVINFLAIDYYAFATKYRVFNTLRHELPLFWSLLSAFKSSCRAAFPPLF